MSDIYLAMADIDSSQLEKASRKLKDAAEVLQKTYNAMRSYDSNLFELYDYWTGYVFSENSSSTVYKQMNSLYSLADSLDAAGALCKNGPDAMAEIDADCRKTLTGWWGSGNAGRTYYGSGTMSGRRGAQSRFFASRSGVTGEDTDVGVEQEDTTSRYQSIVDEFDWSNTTATEEEIDKAVSAGMEKALLAGGTANVTQFIREELKQLYDEKSSTYHKYRNQVKMANGAGLGEKQQEEESGYGLCTYSATTTLLQRRQAVDGHPVTFTFSDVHRANGGSGEVNSDGTWPNSSYAWDRKYVSGDSIYKMSYRFGAVNETEVVTLLDSHPEGIIIYSPSENGANHAIVITDYEINKDGTYQFYANDPVNVRDHKLGRIKIQDTWLYEVNKNIFGTAINVAYLS